MTIRQGEIYAAYLEGGDPRPVVVVSREELNRGNYVVCVPFTARKFSTRRNLPNCVPFRAGEFTFTKNCVVQGEAITLLSKDDLDLADGPWDRLPDERMRDVIRAIGYAISSDCEPI